MSDKSLVSAVIPTFNRPSLVVAAVKSALNQTHADMEIIVVVDGPDDSTSKALGAIADPRIRIVILPRHQGACEARNAGIQAAKGEWIAFLDDDDEWLPRKIELQMAAARRSVHRIPVVSCRVIARMPYADEIWPKRFPSAGEPVSEYIFRRRSLSSGEAMIGTPMLLTRRELLVKHPFRHGLQKHQDSDWVLRVANQEGVGFEFEPTALAICLYDQPFSGITNADDWSYSLCWIEEMRQHITPKAYSSFILLNVARQAASVTTTREYLKLLELAIRRGDPDFFHILLYVGLRLVPRQVRIDVRSMIEKILRRVSQIVKRGEFKGASPTLTSGRVA